MYTVANEPLGIGKTIDKAIKLFFAGFTNVLPLVIVMGIINALPGYLLGINMMSGEIDPASIGPAMLLVFAIFIPISLLLSAAMIAKLGAVAQGLPIGLGAALVRGLKVFFPLLLASIMYVLAVTVGMVLLIIPGLILMLSLIFFSYAIVLDGEGPIASLKTSHRLVWGNWWRTAVVLTIAFFIVYVLMIGFSLPLTFLLINSEPSAMLSIMELVINLVYALLTPLILAMFIVVYQDLKVRKGGLDLAARIEATA